ncbi:hypothetical protein K438DRAFT_2095316 [Mycena galopus ATCC 62051]|nr:hypothetical protein K438DRAFT_2095316 [Mycena galopus ATCC 62051]
MGRARTGPTAPALQTLCHPDRRVQLLCKRRVEVSDGARVADAKACCIDFEDAINNAFTECNKAIADIAKLYNRKESYVHSVLCNISQYKRVRKPTLRNAVIHQRWRDLQGEGETKTLKELREDLQDEIDAGTFSLSSIETKEHNRLINQLLEHRKLKRVGLRATTKAAQLDGRHTSGRIGDTLMDLFECTEIRGFAMFTRGCADDPSAPHTVCSNEALHFFRESLKIPYEDIIRKFEQWLCNRDAGTHEKNGINDVRKEVGQLVGDGLRKVTNSSSITMEWANYDVAIREGKGVEIADFPADIVMSRPALWNMETARRVRDGFHSGAMHWVVMTQEQQAELVALHNAQREALGASSLKKRATCSDKGVPRKKTEGGDAMEEAGPTASSEDDALVPATLIPGLIVVPENKVPVMDMNPYALLLDPTDPAHELLTMDEIVNMQLGMEDLKWLAKNPASSDMPLAAAVSDALTAPITSGFTAVLPAMFSDADTHGTPRRSITATASSTGSMLSTSAPLAAPSNALVPAAPSKTTVSASPSNATAPAPPSHAAASMPQPCGRKRKTAATPGEENAPPKKARKERSDKGVPKMNPDGTFKSQKRREAAEATA